MARIPDRPPDLAERKALERLLAELPEAGSIPRKENELSFEAPWELRALGVTVGLLRAGVFPWADFQQALVSAIREWECAPVEERGEWSYYRQWLRALERLLLERGLAEPEEIDRKAIECVKAAEHSRAHQKAGLLGVDSAHRLGSD
jgi:nitrile hydratase accessory protein